jgi:hypothetical protein
MTSEVTISHGYYMLLNDKAATYDKIRAEYNRKDLSDDDKLNNIKLLLEDSFNLI